MKKDIEKAVLDLQVWINNEFNLLLKNLPKYEVVDQLECCIDSFKHIKQLTNGQQRFLKDLLKLQDSERMKKNLEKAVFEFQELKKCFEQKGMIGIEDLVYVPVDLSGMEIIREYVKENEFRKKKE